MTVNALKWPLPQTYWAQANCKLTENHLKTKNTQRLFACTICCGRSYGNRTCLMTFNQTQLEFLAGGDIVYTSCHMQGWERQRIQTECVVLLEQRRHLTQVNRTVWLSSSHKSSTTRRCGRLLMTSLKHVHTSSVQLSNLTNQLSPC